MIFANMTKVDKLSTYRRYYSNSSLRFAKNVYRSTMREERLNALLLLCIQKDKALDYAAIVHDYMPSVTSSEE